MQHAKQLVTPLQNEEECRYKAAKNGSTMEVLQNCTFVQQLNKCTQDIYEVTMDSANLSLDIFYITCGATMIN